MTTHSLSSLEAAVRARDTVKGSGKLSFYREKISDFKGIARAEGLREAFAVVKKFIIRA